MYLRGLVQIKFGWLVQYFQNKENHIFSLLLKLIAIDFALNYPLLDYFKIIEYL